MRERNEANEKKTEKSSTTANEQIYRSNTTNEHTVSQSNPCSEHIKIFIDQQGGLQFRRSVQTLFPLLGRLL
jgi:hypothetical protein